MDINLQNQLDNDLRKVIDKSGATVYCLRKLNCYGSYWRTVSLNEARAWLRRNHPHAHPALGILYDLQPWKLATVGQGDIEQRTMRYGPVTSDVKKYLELWISFNLTQSCRPYRRTTYSLKHEIEHLGCPEHISESDQMIPTFREMGFDCLDDGTLYAKEIA
jgi:hypothetical protein